MNSSCMRRLIVIAAVALLASACANFTPNNTGEFSRANEIKPGPGIFTGEKGKWVVFEK